MKTANAEDETVVKSLIVRLARSFCETTLAVHHKRTHFSSRLVFSINLHKKFICICSARLLAFCFNDLPVAIIRLALDEEPSIALNLVVASEMDAPVKRSLAPTVKE